MVKSTASADSHIRVLQDTFTIEGFVCSTSRDTNGWPKLTIGTVASIQIEAVDAGADIFGNPIKAFCPHVATCSFLVDANVAVTVAKVMQEVGKLAMKVMVKSSSTDLATAEASTGSPVVSDVQWPSFGA